MKRGKEGGEELRRERKEIKGEEKAILQQTRGGERREGMRRGDKEGNERRENNMM